MSLSIKILVLSSFSFALMASPPELPKIVATFYAPCEHSYGVYSAKVTIDRVAWTYESWSQACGSPIFSRRGTIEPGNVMQKTLNALAMSVNYPPEWRSIEPRKDGSFEIDGRNLVEKDENQQTIRSYVILENELQEDKSI
jgi:hypothetical protein